MGKTIKKNVAEVKFKVSGIVTNKLGEPLPGKQVRVFDVDLFGADRYDTVETLEDLDKRGFEELGIDETDAEGRYEVEYAADRFLKEEYGMADVIAFLVFENKIMARSPLVIQGNSDEILEEITDLNIVWAETGERGITEFDRLDAVIKRFLEVSGAGKLQLTSRHAHFIAGETGEDELLVDNWILANKLFRESEGLKEGIDMFYGIGRQGIELKWQSLVLYSAKDLTGALFASIDQNIIRNYNEKDIAVFVRFLVKIFDARGLKDAVEKEEVFASEILTMTLKDNDKKKSQLLRAYSLHAGDAPAFWNELKNTLNEAEINDLQFTNQLTALTNNNLPLIKRLKERVGDVRDLLKLSRGEWAELIAADAPNAAMGFAEAAPGGEDYVEAMLNLLNAAFPTEKITSMIGNELKPDVGIAEGVANFLKLNVQGEKENIFAINAAWNERWNKEIDQAANEKAPDVINYLQRLQRLYQVSPDAESLVALMESDFNSAFQIASQPEEAFINEFSNKLGPNKAQSIYDRATFQVMRTTNASLTLQEALVSAAPAKTTYGDDASRGKVGAEVNKHLTGWQRLFGAADLCECEECRSVYSPAAYLVDLMKFLDVSGRNAAGESPLAVLFKRREDLRHLLLTCENTFTEIPYIDLVNEVLEYYVAHHFIDKGAAYDTGEAKKAELRANPQNTSMDAYLKLKDKVYPFALPYHQPLDVIRTYLKSLTTSRYELLEVFGDGFSSAAVPEYLGISSEEHEIVTGKKIDGDDAAKEIWEYYGFGNENEYRQNIFKVRVFLQRTGVSYPELVELLKTKFINPGQSILDKLEAMFKGQGLTAKDLYTFLTDIHEGTRPKEIPEVKKALCEESVDPGDFSEWVDETFDDIGDIVTLYEEQSACNLDETTIRSLQDVYNNTWSEEKFDELFKKLHTFIRLWRKSDWSIHELDLLLYAFGETEITPATLRKLFFAQRCNEILKLPYNKLACLWGDIDTYGKASLYRDLFLKRSSVIDPAFMPDGDGLYFTASAKFDDHIPTVLAAFNLTAEKLTEIAADISLDLSTDVSLRSLSAIYRYTVLAKALKIDVTDLVLFRKSFGSPFPGVETTFAFVKKVVDAKADGFKAPVLNYILNDTINENSNFRIKDEKFFKVLLLIRAGIERIELETTIDPNLPVSEEMLRARLMSVFTQELSDTIISAITGTLLLRIKVDSNLAIDVSGLSDKVAYTKATGILEFKGIPTNADVAALKGLVGGNDRFRKGVEELYNAPKEFIAISKSAFETAVSAAEADELLTKIFNRPEGEQFEAVEERLKLFYLAFNPFLKKRLTEQLIVEEFASVIGADPAIAQLLFSLKPGKLEELISATGLNGTYYKDDDFQLEGSSWIDGNIDFDWQGAPVPEVPAATFSVHWQGLISVKTAGEYTIVADVIGADEIIKVSIDNQEVINKEAADEVLSQEGIIKLETGKYYAIDIQYSNSVENASVHLSWRTKNTLTEIIPSDAFFPSSEAEELYDWIRTCHRAAMFINVFKLNANEVAYFVENAAAFDDIDFTSLTQQHWLRVHEYSSLKKEFPRIEKPHEIFIASQAAFANGFDDFLVVLSDKTGWNKTHLQDLILVGFIDDDVTDFRNEKILRNVQKGLKLQRKTGIAVKDLYEWSILANDFDSLHALAKNVKQLVKAKYEENDWLDVAKDLSNTIRENQQKALINYLLTRTELITNADMRASGQSDADGLFEYFLIDVQMSSCLDTSRIKQAISSVQLFVARCLLNLEPEVDPVAISLTRWEWMKNYRVWEANRKVFIYPENWIDPELRDDKSPFFRELESDLLQSDITYRSVEDAFRSYLGKLSEVASLDICGLYQDYPTQVMHIFGRTYSSPYQYFYRTYNLQHRSWAAWEKVGLDIRGVEDGSQSGVHLLPMVWKGRLFLFWPEFFEKTEEAKYGNDDNMHSLAATPTKNIVAKRYWEVKLAWSEFKDRKWTPKQLSREALVLGTLESFLVNMPSLKKAAFEEHLRKYRLSAFVTTENALRISVTNESKELGYFLLPDIQSTFTVGNALDMMMMSTIKVLPTTGLSSGSSTSVTMLFFPIGDTNRNFFMSSKVDGKFALKGNTYLDSIRPHRYIHSHHYTDFESTLKHPFFYQDGERAFFVEPETISYKIKVLVTPREVPHIAINFSRHKLRAPLVTTKVLPVANRAVSRAAAAVRPAALVRGGMTSMNKTAKTSGIFAEKFQIPAAFGGALLPTAIYRDEVKMDQGLRFYNFYHPFPGDFISALNQRSIEGLLESDTDVQFRDNGEFFTRTYNPVFKDGFVNSNVPKRNVDFGEFSDGVYFYGAYSIYNWELFFHAPLFIATRLSRNGKYAEAMKWFHYVFDPTSNEPVDPANPNAKYWKVEPFRTAPEFDITEFFKSLVPNPNAAPADGKDIKISEWRDNPFKPHLVARGRPLAYMKNVVMRYVENLLAWGDDLFRRDTMESINEATQIYVIAAHVLGKRPERVPKRGEVGAETYDTLHSRLDSFGNAMVQFENIFPFSSGVPAPITTWSGSLLGIGSDLYFCIPNNDKLLKYWDDVADRLFKIRHCMNIEGVKRSLSLFEPPIDPGLLVKAAAQGISIGNLLSEVDGPAPFYRFNYLLQKANELCSEIKGLGSSLLSAIEKRDGEELGRLRQSHEGAMLELMKSIKERQLLEAKTNRQSLEVSRNTAKKRLNHFLGLLGVSDLKAPDAPQLSATLNADSQLPADTIIRELVPDVDTGLKDSDEAGVKLIPREAEELDKNDTAKWIQVGVNTAETLAAILNLIPDIQIFGSPLGVGGGAKTGGFNWASAISAGARAASGVASFISAEAAKAAKMGSYIRRDQDWTFQANAASREIIQLDKQITSADIRIQIAQREVDNHLRQIQNSEEISMFLRGETVDGFVKKFSTTETYQWMKEQLMSVYKQSYHLAYDMAKKSEKAYRFELGKPDASFIQYGYWDSTYEGLLSGEKLQLSLRQMEKSYIEENTREFELTKHVSLALLDPKALLALKHTGTCELSIPEEAFDLDYPGHYFRRLKSVRLSIPCIAGPYTSINCTLRLVKNSIRFTTAMSDDGSYARNNDEGVLLDDMRFVEAKPPFRKVATSTAQNDGGLFELSFRDERYLPFEGAGAISTWSIELTGKFMLEEELFDFSQFDFSSISDVILHLNYTSREDAGLFKEGAISHLRDYLESADGPTPFVRMFNLKSEFPDAFHRLVTSQAESRSCDINVKGEHFPWLFGNKDINAMTMEVFLLPKQGVEMTEPAQFRITLEDPEDEENKIVAAPNGAWAQYKKTTVVKSTMDISDFDPMFKWKIQSEQGALSKDEIENVFILISYHINP